MVIWRIVFPVMLPGRRGHYDLRVPPVPVGVPVRARLPDADGDEDDAAGARCLLRGAHHEVGLVMAAAALTTLPPLLLFLPLQTKLSAGLAAGAVKK